MESLFLYLGITFYLTLNSILLKNNKTLLILTCVFTLSLTYGLRVGIGNDYEQYNNIYNQVNYNLYNAIEPTYIILSKLFYPLENGFNYLVASYSFISFILCYIGVKKYDIYSYLPIMMLSCGFIFFIDNQIRQALAMSFFVFYMRYIHTREFGKYLTCVLISTVFAHFSSIILLSAYFIRKKKISNTVWILLLISSFILMKIDAVGTILYKLISVVPYYSELYLQRFNNIEIEQAGSGLGVLFWLMIAVFIVLYSDKVNDPVLINLFLLGTLINTVFINYDIFERISFYFIYLRFIILAIIIKKIIFKNNIEFMISIIIFMLTLVFTCYEILNDANKHGSVPFSLLYYKVES